MDRITCSEGGGGGRIAVVAFVAKQSESALDSNSRMLNRRVNGSAQRRSLALEMGALAAEGLLVVLLCLRCMCFMREHR